MTARLQSDRAITSRTRGNGVEFAEGHSEVGIQLRGLERERVRRGLTRKQLAERAGLAYTYVTELETGKRLAGAEAHRRLSRALAAIPVLVDLVGRPEADAAQP